MSDFIVRVPKSRRRFAKKVSPEPEREDSAELEGDEPAKDTDDRVFAATPEQSEEDEVDDNGNLVGLIE